MHSHRPSDKWDESAGEIMKLSKDYEPGAILFNLFSEILELGSPESEPISISLKKGISIPFSKEISDSVSDECSDNRKTDHIPELYIPEFPEKTSNEEHNLLSGNEYSDDRE